MTPEFDAYLNADARGVKAETRRRIDHLVTAVPSGPARLDWIEEYAPRCPGWRMGRLRHELARDVILPGVVDGHRLGRAWHTAALGHLWSQYVGITPALPDDLEGVGAQTLLRSAFEAAPDHAWIRDRYRRLLAARLDYAFHEWPAGVLLAPDERPASAAVALREMMDTLDTLDPASRERIAEYRRMLNVAEEDGRFGT